MNAQSVSGEMAALVGYDCLCVFLNLYYTRSAGKKLEACSVSSMLLIIFKCVL